MNAVLRTLTRPILARRRRREQRAAAVAAAKLRHPSNYGRAA